MELMDANAHGNVHGGVIMRMVDESAAIVAIKHSQCPTVVTARVEMRATMISTTSKPLVLW